LVDLAVNKGTVLFCYCLARLPMNGRRHVYDSVGITVSYLPKKLNSLLFSEFLH